MGCQCVFLNKCVCKDALVCRAVSKELSNKLPVSTLETENMTSV